jgi:hypothetical protein
MAASQRQSHFRIDVCCISAPRRGRHADETNSFPHGKLTREQLRVIDANVERSESARRAIASG